MKKNFSALRAVAAVGVALACSQAQAGLINGGFEAYGQAASNYGNYTDTSYAGWRTTAPDHQVEIWGNNFLGVPAYQGTDFAELNANYVSTLYQDVPAIAAGSLVGFQFAHRGRAGVDTMRLTITDLGADNAFGTADDKLLFTNLYSDGASAWGFYVNPAPLVALGNQVRFAYEAVSAAGGPTIGNFLDAADFGVSVGLAVPEPGTLALAALGVVCSVGASRSRRRGKAE